MVIVCLLWTTAAENGFENLIIAAMFRIFSRGEAAVQKLGSAMPRSETFLKASIECGMGSDVSFPAEWGF